MDKVLENETVIEQDQLVKEVSLLKTLGYRFVTLSCEREGQEYELIYHFDRNYTMKNLRMKISGKEPLTSISDTYPPAFLIENEYQDLYGFTFKNLAIDYKGRLYLTEDGPKSPLSIEEKE